MLLYDNLNLAFRAVLKLYRDKRVDLLNLIDTTGQLATGDVTPVYAALCLLRYTRQMECGLSSNADLSNELDELLERVYAGVLPMKQAKTLAHMTYTTFKRKYESKYGTYTRRPGRNWGA
jgi:hypothetical protein